MPRKTPSVSVRMYQDDDRSDVAVVWQESWNGTGIDPGQRPSVFDYEQRLSGQGRNWDIFVAIISARIIGFVAFQRADGWLRQLFVSPSCQGVGVGRLLLGLAKAEMPGGFWLRTDAANAVAKRFYESAGLAFGGEGTHPVHGQNVVTYVWPSSN